MSAGIALLLAVIYVVSALIAFLGVSAWGASHPIEASKPSYPIAMFVAIFTPGLNTLVAISLSLTELS